MEGQERRCRGGLHGPLVRGAIVEYARCVNVDEVCERCGGIVKTVSYSKEAWQKQLEGESGEVRGGSFASRD